MQQRELHRVIAQITGESQATIERLGFSLLPVPLRPVHENSLPADGILTVWQDSQSHFHNYDDRSLS